MSNVPNDFAAMFVDQFLGSLTDDDGIRCELQRLVSEVIEQSVPNVSGEKFTQDDRFSALQGVGINNDSDSTELTDDIADQREDQPCDLSKLMYLSEGQHRLTLGELFAAPLVENPSDCVSSTKHLPAEVKTLVGRCRLKADACEWQLHRNTLRMASANYETEIRSQDEELYQRGQSLSCDLWMCSPHQPRPTDLKEFKTIANGFRVVADSVLLLSDILAEEQLLKEFLVDAMVLVAEAQSALRVLLGDIGKYNDQDQYQVHRWLKGLAQEKRQFISRYMRLDDPADPSQLPALVERLRSLKDSVQERKNQEFSRRELMGKVRDQANQIANGKRTQWPSLIRAVDQLVPERVPASDKELRKCLLPIIESRPVSQEEEPEGFLSVVSAIQEYVSQQSSAADLPDKEPIDDVQEVAERLGDSAVLLVGGACDHVSKRRIEQVFKLKKLIHVKTWTLRSPTDLQHVVARKDVSIVLLTSDCPCQFDLLNIDCKLYGKPLVRLGADLSPKQVARKILEQCGDGFDDNGNESAG